MINLLPPDMKENYRYGRHNHALAGCGAILLVGGGYLYIDRDITSVTSQIADTDQQLKTQNQTAVKKQVTDISNNLKLATEVLSKEVLFSKLIKQLGAVTPNNVLLSDLAITQTQGALEISALSTDYPAAAQFQTNLTDPNNQIFQTADIESIDCGGQTANPTYPCKVNIRALFGNNSQFLFISPTAKGSTK
jgi:Tfp pilus assembly protein PilN